MNIKVILNKDISPLGEEGDVKEVARGYARNYLLPRGIALPYTPGVVKVFEGRRAEIEARKEQKRKDALGIKEKLEEMQLTLVMPAGENGRLYGAVTSQSISDELAKQGISIERKRIEIPGNSIKSVGKYKFSVKLYGNAAADMNLVIEAVEEKVRAQETHSEQRRHKSWAKPAAQKSQSDAEETVKDGSPSVVTPEPEAQVAG